MSRIIKYALSLCIAICGLQAAAQSEQSSSLKLWMDDFSVTADGQTVSRLHVYESDTCNYCAYNMALVLPKGLSIAKVNNGRDYVDDVVMSNRATSTHTILANMLEDGTTVKIISISLQNDTLYTTDVDGNPLEEIFSIGFTADPSMINGEYKIQFEGIKFVLPNAFAYIPVGNIEASLTISGGSGGVNSVVKDAEEEQLYDLLGRPVKNPQNGIYVKNGNKVVINHR